MTHNIACYRCGTSLAALSLPLSRQDECPECSNYLHVCKMCRFFDAAVPRQCSEDGAEDVLEKDRLNFCDWFEPSELAFEPNRKDQENQALGALDTLFDDSPDSSTAEQPDRSDAEKLFK